ncbi:uncharacterized protein NECHADRAFT_78130 [Fusarium vanettenii 77-13-4]|uniref:RRM domain-containing protein n=1 Tax=Fusarium vanettenii (strain ATCC MYA-4622 / CBS 123669 / FGSC 9596 / NRRL 45880 / 77-13-4) TaxID=660122 RepID=C7YN74_FUSV7|nr:uncharacterized protein NECHADRAFT_78130 [Fusarium vanettenii 77-13-4]EEU47072.1 hypothetical protein NECHADRAFT_78130 [Fusarium vanettenii 77-13-4]
MPSSTRRRPRGAARHGANQLRNAFSALDIQRTADSGSDSSDDQIRPRALHVAKSFPPPRSFGDADDESQSFSGSGPSNSDGMTGRDNTGTDTSVTQEIPHQEQISQPLINPEAIQDASGQEWDAQSCYPSEACVFVANLSQNYDDLTLQSAVTKVFNLYGTVFVKIKRDKRQMPFGFAQYTKPEDAEKALANLRGVEILGRPVRVERCNANLIFLIIRRNKGKVSHNEARDLLSPFGAIAKVEDLDPATQERLGLSPAVRVRFERFDPRRDVIRGVGDNTPFVIINFDFKVAQDPSERDPHDVTCMITLERDSRSVFLGSLPAHTTEYLVRELGSGCGTIVSTQIKQSVDGSNGMASFYAFIEYDHPNGPDKAIAKLASPPRCNGYRIGGTSLRCERRRTKSLHATPAGSTGPYGTVPPNRPHRRNASAFATAFVTPNNDAGSQRRRSKGHQRSASVYDVLAGPKTADFSMGAWPPKDESPYDQSQPKGQSFRRSSSYRQSSVYEPSYIELQSGQSPYQETSFRKPTYAGSEYQQLQYQRLQASPLLQAHSPEILQPEPLRITARRLFDLEETTAMGPPSIPAYAPLASVDMLKPTVHWAPSPDMSSTGSSDFERNPYLSNAYRASTLGPSFGQRMAGHRSGARRSVTNIFPSIDDAVARASSTLEESEDAKIQSTLAKAFTRSHHLSEENLKHNNKVEDDLLKRTARSEEHLRLGRLNLSCDDLKRSAKADKGEKSNKVVKADKNKTPKTPKSSKKKAKDQAPQSTVDALASGGHNNLVPQGMMPLPYMSMVPPYQQAFAYPGAPGAQVTQPQGMMHPMMQAQMANAQVQAMQAQMMASQMMSSHMAHPQLMPQMMPQGMTPGFGYMPAAYPQQAQYQNAYGANMMYTGNPAYPYVIVESPTRQANVTEQVDIYEDGQNEESEEETSEQQTEEASTGYEDSAFSD